MVTKVKKINNRKIKLLLNKNFYKEEAIKEAIEKFKEICNIYLKKDISSFEITLSSNSEHLLEKNIELEFSNYVIVAMKNKLLV